MSENRVLRPNAAMAQISKKRDVPLPTSRTGCASGKTLLIATRDGKTTANQGNSGGSFRPLKNILSDRVISANRQ